MSIWRREPPWKKGTAGWRSPELLPSFAHRLPSGACGCMAVVLLQGKRSLLTWTSLFVWLGGVAFCEFVQVLGARSEPVGAESGEE